MPWLCATLFQVVVVDASKDSTEQLCSAMEGADAVVCAIGMVPSYVPGVDRDLSHAIDNMVSCLLHTVHAVCA
eukprot:7399752-Pyramimonas_sp.AAC.2